MFNDYKLPKTQDIPKDILLKNIRLYFDGMNIYEFVKEYNRLFPENQVVLIEDGFFAKECDWRKL
jgi:hypothetical protein